MKTRHTRHEITAARTQASINSASRICLLAIRSLGSGKVLFQGFSGEATVSVLFRVRLALGSQLRDGGVHIVSDPIILTVQIRRSSVFLTKNLTSNESCETLVFRHSQVSRPHGISALCPSPILLSNNRLRTRTIFRYELHFCSQALCEHRLPLTGKGAIG
jgi:hypothetical protein